MLESLTEQLKQAQPLSDEQVVAAVDQLVQEQVDVEAKADFLSVLAEKGESTAEIAAFARELRSRSVQPELDPETRSREILDVCGTGGDHLNTFNISTTVAFVAASAGICVAKHGNRAITSKAGSADVLEELGVRIDLSPAEAAQSLRERQFAFFFAPKYHPAFKHIAPARKLCAQRGRRTIFNFLGPLLNPVRPTAQLIGVPGPQLCEPLARVLQSLGIRRAMVVSGSIPGEPNGRHLDELSVLGDTAVAEFYQERGFACSVLSPRDFPVQPAQPADLAGGDRAANAEIVRRILRGDDRGPRRDAVLLNSAAALFVGGTTAGMSDGWTLAAELMDSGRAFEKLKQLIES